MKRNWCFLSLALLLALVPITLAFASGSFDLSWWTVDSGGGQSNGGDYSILGVAGQPDAYALHGGGFILLGGYLSGVTALPPPLNIISLPLVIK